jgi:hypothetical protein
MGPVSVFARAATVPTGPTVVFVRPMTVFVLAGALFARAATVSTRPTTVFVGPMTMFVLAGALFGPVARSFSPLWPLSLLLTFRMMSVLVFVTSFLLVSAVARFLFLLALTAFLIMLGGNRWGEHERRRDGCPDQQRGDTQPQRPHSCSPLARAALSFVQPSVRGRAFAWLSIIQIIRSPGLGGLRAHMGECFGAGGEDRKRTANPRELEDLKHLLVRAHDRKLHVRLEDPVDADEHTQRG